MSAEKYAQWIVENQDKQGTPEFETVAAAYKAARNQTPQAPQAPQTPQEPSLLQRLGKGVADYARRSVVKKLNRAAGAVEGAGSIGATLLTPYDLLAGNTQSIGNPERRQAIEQGLQSMGADPESADFQAAKILTQMAGTAGAGSALAKGLGMIPGVASRAPALINALRTSGMTTGAAPVTTGAKAANLALRAGAAGTTGALAGGMINPEDAGTAGAVSAAIPLVSRATGAAGSYLGQKMRPKNVELAQLAQKYNIPVGLGDLAESRMVQAGRSILKDTPITGGMAATAQEAKQEAFNRAVGQTFGANAPKLTLDVIDDAKKTLGNKFDEIWNNNNLVVAPNMLQTIENVKKQAQKLPKNEAGAVLREIDDLYSKIVPDASGNSIIPGDVANKFQSYLRRRAESFPALSDEFTKLRRSIIDTFNDSVKPEDAAALTINRSQYKAFKTVEPLIRNAELGIAGREAGDIPAALLPQAVNRSYGDLRNVPLAELSKLGSRVLVDRTPQTGGSMRALLQLGALGGSAMAGLPGLAAGATTAVGIQELLRNPRLANAVMRPGSGAPNQLLIDLLRAGQLSAPVIAAQ